MSDKEMGRGLGVRDSSRAGYARPETIEHDPRPATPRNPHPDLRHPERNGPLDLPAAAGAAS